MDRGSAVVDHLHGRHPGRRCAGDVAVGVVADVGDRRGRDAEGVGQRDETPRFGFRRVDAARDDDGVEGVAPPQSPEFVPLGPLGTVGQETDPVALAEGRQDVRRALDRLHGLADGLAVGAGERAGVRPLVEERLEHRPAALGAAVLAVGLEVGVPVEAGVDVRAGRRVLQQRRTVAARHRERVVEVERDGLEHGHGLEPVGYSFCGPSSGSVLVAARASPPMSFFDDLRDRIAAVDSVVSVGLDPDRDRLPEFLDGDLPRWQFNRRIIDATHEHAACFKPNAAFYEDPDGWRALEETVAYAHGKGVPVLLDAKRGDIGNTARQYADLLDDDGLGVDAMTVNPYMGRDTLEPYLSMPEKGVIVLCRTSNPGGADFQNLEVGNGKPLYEYVAQRAAEWNEHDNVGLVVGATAPEELEAVRELVDLPFLVPGVGAQGGDAEAAIEYGLADGVGLVNSSRGVIFAGEGADDEAAYFRAAGDAAKKLKRRLNRYR